MFETKKLSSKHTTRKWEWGYLFALSRGSYIFQAYLNCLCSPGLATNPCFSCLSSAVEGMCHPRNIKQDMYLMFYKGPTRLGAVCEGWSVILRTKDCKLACIPLGIQIFSNSVTDYGTASLFTSRQTLTYRTLKPAAVVQKSYFKVLCDLVDNLRSL